MIRTHVVKVHPDEVDRVAAHDDSELQEQIRHRPAPVHAPRVVGELRSPVPERPAQERDRHDAAGVAGAIEEIGRHELRRARHRHPFVANVVGYERVLD